ncbi:MAG: glycoside hydrolase family 9 protein [Candidatus Lokiarchaeota archaeon]|nr:glycoside hydrolase family 9 protein [Candidatus Lokiarchaeota archaeon]
MNENPARLTVAERCGPAARLAFTLGYLGLAALVFFAYPVIGYVAEHGSFDAVAFFTGDVFGNYRISLADALLDAEQLLANFITAVLFSLVLSAFLVHYGPSKAEAGTVETAGRYSRRARWLGIAAAGILGAAIVLTVTGIGYTRPELEGQAASIMFGNFHPENFSVHVLYYIFLFSGLPGFLYLVAAGKANPRRSEWSPEHPRAGLFLFIAALLILVVVALFSPLVAWDVVHARTSIREILYSIIDSAFIAAIVLVIEWRDRVAVQQPANKKRTYRGMARIVRHMVLWAIPAQAFLGLVIYMFSQGYLELFISVAYYLSRAWTFGFTVVFTMFLYHVGMLAKVGRAAGRWKLPKLAHAKPRALAAVLIAGFAVAGFVMAFKASTDDPVAIVNQAGYLPTQDKTFLVKARYLHQSGRFDVSDAASGVPVLSGLPLEYVGTSWGAHYYRGNASAITSSGSYRIVARFTDNGVVTATTAPEPLTVGTDIYDLAARRGYEFFYYQRCGTRVHEIVPGYVGHEPCHMDDGIVYKGAWLNLTGAWHSAGDYAKHIYWGMHCEAVIYSCLLAYELSPAIYDGIDRVSTGGDQVPNGVPDILDEAMWGLDYYERAFLDNGTLLGSLLGELVFCPPEHDTDNLPGTADDRHLFWEENHVVARPYEAMYVAAGFAKMARIARDTPYFNSKEAEMWEYATNIYGNFSTAFNFTAPNYPAINSDASSFLVATLEMHRYAGSAAFGSRLAEAAAYIHDRFPDPAVLWGDELGEWNRVPGYLCYWALVNGSATARAMAADVALAMYDGRFQLLASEPGNPFGMMEVEFEDGRTEPFWARIGLNSYYLTAAFTAFLAYNVTSATRPDILDFGLRQLGFVLGANPYGISMVEGVGTRNPPIYHHRYAYIPGNPRGAVPGAIINGIIEKDGVPFMNVNSAAGSSIQDHLADAMSNEPWLPHNVHFMFAMGALLGCVLGK